MKPEEQRIAIAQACGWSNVKIYPRSEQNKRHSEDTEPIGIGCRHPSWGGGSCSVPDYLNDLNAMYDAEMKLTSQQMVLYDRFLKLSNSDSARTCDFEAHLDDFTWSRSSSQRAKAFLQTLNLWQE